MTGFTKALTVLLGCMLIGASASPTRTTLARSDSEEHPGTVRVELPTGIDSESPRWVRLEVSAELTAGTEVQLWRDVGAAAPWIDGGQDGLLDVWIVDGRDDGRVVFDLTRLMRRGAPPSELFLRILSRDGEEQSLSAQTLGVVLEAAR